METTDAMREHCVRLLLRRQKEVGNGGVGLMMGCGWGASEPVQRLHARHRVLRALVVVSLLGLCSAAGFASARLWDGRGSTSLDLDFASQVAAEKRNGENERKSAAGRISYFAERALEHLCRLQDDPELAGFAKTSLVRLRALIPDPAAAGPDLDAEVTTLKLRSATLELRQRALESVRAKAHTAIRGLLFALQDPELATTAKDHLRKVSRAALSELEAK